MKPQTSFSRAALSLVLTIAVAAVFTLHSFAAAGTDKPAGEPIPPQDCTGTLTVKAGQVSINGNAAQTGATILTGSVISTGSNGKAIVDLGTLGRVEIGDNATATLTCAASLLEIKTTCSKTEVEVRRGTVDVRSPKTETLVAGKKAHYDGGIDATSTGGADIKIECEGGKAGAGSFVGPGLVGLLALVGLGAAVAIGIGQGRAEENAPPSSPVR